MLSSGSTGPAVCFSLLILYIAVLNVGPAHASSQAYCSFKSSCDGTPQGGQYCNKGKNNCENHCDGNWCTASPPPSSDYFCSFNNCYGGPQGGTYCNKNYNACTRDCGGEWCEDVGSPPTYEPEDDGCYLMYRGWLYKAKQGSKFYRRYDDLHLCLTECGSGDIVVLDKEGRCQCWKKGSGEWVNNDKRMSFVGDPSCSGEPWDAPLVDYDEGCLVTQYPGYQYKSVGNGDWFDKHNMLHKCFNRCIESGKNFAIDGEDESCYW